MPEPIRFQPRTRLADELAGLGAVMPADMLRLRDSLAPASTTAPDWEDQAYRLRTRLTACDCARIRARVMAGLGWFLALIFLLALGLVG